MKFLKYLNRTELIFILVSLPFSLYAPPMGPAAGVAGQEPMQISEQEIAQMFGVSPEEASQMANMMREFDAAIKKDPELQKMFNEFEQQLEQEIQQGLSEGKSYEEILGLPGLATPEQLPAPKPTPVPMPVTENEKKVEEKPKQALRSRSQAEQIIQSLLATLGKIQSKAAAQRSVAETLAPLQPQLDLVVYYLHVISKPAHIEQLVTDPEMTSLHDALQRLDEKLSAEEPLFITAEVGEYLNKSSKERSKIALQNIVSDINSALRAQLIGQLEKLVKKYEPQALKLRAEAESAVERAKKEAEARKIIRPVPAQIKREEEYGRHIRQGRGRFDDWYYGRQRPAERFAGREGFGPERTFGGEGAEPAAKQPSSKQSTSGGGKSGAEDKKEEKKEPKYSSMSNEGKQAYKKITEIKDIFEQIDDLVARTFNNRSFTQELRAPVDAQFNELKETVESLASAVVKVRKLKIDADAAVRKINAADMRSTYEQQLHKEIEKRRQKLCAVQQAAIAVPPARHDQFDGSCPGANCLDYLIETIEGIYTCGGKIKKEAEAAGRQPQQRQAPAAKPIASQVVQEALQQPRIPMDVQRGLHDLSNQDRNELEEILGGAQDYQQYQALAAGLLGGAVGAFGLRWLWDWFQEWRADRAAQAAAAEQPGAPAARFGGPQTEAEIAAEIARRAGQALPPVAQQQPAPEPQRWEPVVAPVRPQVPAAPPL